MVRVKRNCGVYFDGISSRLIEGTIYPKSAPIVISNRILFEEIVNEIKQESKVEIKKESTEHINIQEELLVEEPVMALSVELEESTRKKNKRG